MNIFKKRALIYLFLFFSKTVFSQIVVINSTPDSIEIGLKKINTTKWKYHKGDTILWAKTDFNDDTWDSVKTILNLNDLPQNYFTGIGWFRFCLNIDTILVNKPLAFSITHNGASEIYLNGKKVNCFGKVCASVSCEDRIDPQYKPFAVTLNKCKNNVIAIRYSNTMAGKYFKKYDEESAGFDFKISSVNHAISSYTTSNETILFVFMSFFGFFIALCFLHFLIFLFYKKQPANLHYSIFSFMASLVFLFTCISSTSPLPDYIIKIGYYSIYCFPVLFISLLAMIYTLFKYKYSIYFKICISLLLLFIMLELFCFLTDFRSIYISVLIAIICFDSGYRVWQAVKQKKEGAWIIASGVMIFLLLIGVFLAIGFLNSGININGSSFYGILLISMFILIILSIPFSMSIYLAHDFARTNKNLSTQIDQVQTLSKQMIEQEQEKQKILNEQNMLLEHQVVERTAELSEKNQEMTDSITYAKRLQEAILPSIDAVRQQFKNSFIYYQPKDIVAGDFYWMHTIKDSIFIAAADCTGHGVPGAMVSVVCSNALNRAVNEFNLRDTGLILDKTRELVIETFEKSDSEVKDGMDISLIRIENLKDGKKEIQWSGANNSLWYILNNELIEVKADKQPIGKCNDQTPFTSNVFNLNSPVTFYLFSDGYADQFSPDDKKLMKKTFKDIVLAIQNLSMNEQKNYLEKFHAEWKGVMEQTDDILVIGLKV